MSKIREGGIADLDVLVIRKVQAILDWRALHFFLRVLGSLMCDCACIPSLMRRLVPRLKLFSLQPDPRAGMSARTSAN